MLISDTSTDTQNCSIFAERAKNVSLHFSSLPTLQTKFHPAALSAGNICSVPASIGHSHILSTNGSLRLPGPLHQLASLPHVTNGGLTPNVTYVRKLSPNNHSGLGDPET